MLFCAGLTEVVWLVGLKRSDGFTVVIPSIVTLAAMTASITLLSFAIRSIPIGTAYAVWNGIGIVGAAAAGILLEGEPINTSRIVFIALIFIGVSGLKLVSPD